MAIWAFGRLADPAAFDAERSDRLSREADPTVRAEWKRLDYPQ